MIKLDIAYLYKGSSCLELTVKQNGDRLFFYSEYEFLFNCETWDFVYEINQLLKGEYA